MLALRRRVRGADLVHYQWLTVQPLDVHLLPPARPRVLTAHDVLPREPRPGQVAATRRLARRMDAVVVHSEHGARRLRDELGVDAERVRVIPHGAFDYLTRQPDERPLPAELAAVEGPVVLFFGLLRPYKGVDVLLEAFRSVRGAELWVVGMPRMDIEPLEELARRRAAPVRFVPRFVHRPRDPGLLPPRRSRRAALPRDRPVRRALHRARVRRAARALGGRRLHRGGRAPRRRAPRAAGRPAARSRPRSTELLADPDARERLRGAAARAAAGPYSWDAVGPRTLALYEELPPDPHRCVQPRRTLITVGRARDPSAVLKIALLDVGRRAARLHPRRLPAAAVGCSPRGRRARRAPRRPARTREPSVSLDRRRLRRGGGDRRARSANALALDYPRDRLEVIVASDGSTDAHRRARRERRRRPRARPAARRQGPRPGRRASSARAARSSPSRDANSTLGARRAARLVEPFADPRSATCAARCASPTTAAARTRRAPTGATRWRSASSSRGSRGVTAGNGAIYATRREAYIVVDPRMGHDLSFPFNMVKRGWRALYEPERARRRRRWCPTIEGEFARKRRMMSHTWPIVIQGGMLSPRGYRPLYALADLLPPRAALRHAVPPPDRARRQRRRCCAAGRVYVARRSLPSSRCSPRRCSAARHPLAAAPARPLLRARHGLARRRALVDWLRTGTPAGVGEGRGHAVTRALDVLVARARARAHRAAARRSPLSRSGSSRTGRPIYRQRRVGRDGEPFEMLKLRTMVSGAEQHRRRASRSTTATRASPASARSCAASRSTSCRTSSTCCAARCRSSARARRSRRRSTSTPPRQRRRLEVQAGHHRLGAGERPRVAAVARADRARRLVRRPPLAAARPADPRADRPHARDRARASTRERRADGSRARSRHSSPGSASATTSSARSPSTRSRSPPTRARSRRRGTRRDVRVAPPRIDDPGYVPFLQELVEEHDVRAVVPLTDLDIEVLAARRPARLRAGRPRSAARPTTSTRRTSCCCALGLPSPPTVLPGEEPDVLPGDGQAAPGLRRALDPPRRRPRADGVLRPLRGRAGDGAAADGRRRSSRSTSSATSTGAA